MMAGGNPHISVFITGVKGNHTLISPAADREAPSSVLTETNREPLMGK